MTAKLRAMVSSTRVAELRDRESAHQETLSCVSEEVEDLRKACFLMQNCVKKLKNGRKLAARWSHFGDEIAGGPVHSQQAHASNQRAARSSGIIEGVSPDFKDLETGSSSGSIHAPGKPSVFLSFSSPSSRAIQSHLTEILPQLSPQHLPGHDQATEPHTAEAVGQFGCLSEQSSRAGSELKGFTTAGGNTVHREDQAFALQLQKETEQHLLLLVKIGREATRVWLHSCYRRIAKQGATVCSTITLQEEILLAPLTKHEVTRCEKACCMDHTNESQS